MYQLIQNKLGGLKLGEHNMIGQNSKEEKSRNQNVQFSEHREKEEKNILL